MTESRQVPYIGAYPTCVLHLADLERHVRGPYAGPAHRESRNLCKARPERERVPSLTHKVACYEFARV